MNPDENSYHGRLADRDLDKLLAAANKDLLAHIEAAADLTPTLIAITTHDSPPGPAKDSKAPHSYPRAQMSGRYVHGSHHGEPGADTDLRSSSGLVLTAYKPSELASIKTAISTATRGSFLARLWHWRYETGLAAGVLLATLLMWSTLGLTGLIVVATALAIGAAAVAWPPSRRRIIARVWCVITPHRVRTGCTLQPESDQERAASDRAVHDAHRARRASAPGCRVGTCPGSDRGPQHPDGRVLGQRRPRPRERPHSQIVELEVIRRSAAPRRPTPLTPPPRPPFGKLRKLTRGSSKGKDETRLELILV